MRREHKVLDSFSWEPRVTGSDAYFYGSEIMVSGRHMILKLIDWWVRSDCKSSRPSLIGKQ